MMLRILISSFILCSVGFGSLDGFEDFVQKLLDTNSSRTTEQEANDRENKLDCAVSTAVCTQSNVAKKTAAELRHLVDDGNERDHDHCSRSSRVQQTIQIGNNDTAVKEDEHENEGLSLLASLSQTPGAGVEDAADEHTSSTVGKQSSPGMLSLWLRYILFIGSPSKCC